VGSGGSPRDLLIPAALGRGSSGDGARVVTQMPMAELERAQRKPRLLLRFDGAFLLRFEAESLDASLLFQLPPRLTRSVDPGETMTP
jgi:hypothetical protein